MKKLLITLLAMSSLSAYSAEISFSAEINAGAKVLHVAKPEHRAYLMIVMPSVGASYEVTKSQMLSVNLGVAYLEKFEDFASKGIDPLSFIKLGIEYSFMVFEKNGFELSIAPSFGALLGDNDGRGDDYKGRLEANLTFSLQKNIMDNLYVQLEIAAPYLILDTADDEYAFVIPSWSTIGLKWMF